MGSDSESDSDFWDNLYDEGEMNDHHINATIRLGKRHFGPILELAAVEWRRVDEEWGLTRITEASSTHVGPSVFLVSSPFPSSHRLAQESGDGGCKKIGTFKNISQT